MFAPHRRRSRSPLHPTWIAAISVCAWAQTARAQSADAESLFDDGDRLMKQGKIAEACEAFEASNRIEQRAGTLIRLGDCREDNHQLASAWSAFKDALTRVKDAKKKAIATAKLAEVEPKLSYLTVTVPDANKLDGLELTRNGQALDPALWNRPGAIDGGDYVIVAHAPDHKDWTTSITVPDESGKISVDVPKLDDAPKPPPVVVKPVVPTPVTPVTSPIRSRWTTRREIAVVTGGVAMLGLASGIVFGLDAKAKQKDADNLCQDPSVPCSSASTAQSLNSTAHRRAGIANISFGVAGVAAVATGVLWLIGAPEARGVAIVPSPHGTSVTLTRAF
jgi:hypothetical protein